VVARIARFTKVSRSPVDATGSPSTYYHGYHAIDYYAVEDRFGDLATLRELVATAHALGLKVIQDQVANHVGSYHPWVRDPPLDNWFHPRQVNRPFRPDLSYRRTPAPRRGGRCWTPGSRRTSRT
jgi:glycosidase